MRTLLSRFRREEDGNASVEFAIMFPVIILVFMSMFEVAMIATRSALLERALDITMRGVRITTGLNPTHDMLRDQICEYGAFLPDCKNTLILEMTPVQMPGFNMPNYRAPCIDRDTQAVPKQEFVSGTSNELMVVRACYVVEPLFPISGMGLGLTRDSSGGFQIVSASGFVAEP